MGLVMRVGVVGTVRRVFAVSSMQTPPRAGFVGMGGLACLLFCCLGTARFVPWWVTTLLVVAWVVLLVRAVGWFVPHPGRLPWLVLVGFAGWFGVVAGGAWLGAWGG